MTMKRNPSHPVLGLVLSTLALLVAACGAAPPNAAVERPSSTMQAPAPPVLDRSLFSKDVTGTVSEADLQRILDSHLDLSFPARVGVVVLAEPFRAEAGAPITEQGIIASEVSKAIRGSSRYSHVTNVSTDLPNPQGLEGLRTIAARYRIRYLLLCSAKIEDRSHLNNWAWLYPTVVGFFALPGVTVASDGMLQASLLDVRTGTVLFTASEPYQSSDVTWVIGSGRHHRQVDGQALQDASTRLARSVLTQTETLAEWAAQDRKL
jgi:rhombotail lipoprotein